LKRSVAVVGSVLALGWMLLWGRGQNALSATIIFHWPLLLILLWGFTNDLRGGLLVALAAVAVVVGMCGAGWVSNWTLVGWQVLIFGIFGLYPFKFMQIREERRHHYQTLLEYKKGEMGTLEKKLADIDRKCRELEQGKRRPAEPDGGVGQ